MSGFSCYAVIKPCPDRKEDVTMTDSCIRRIAPMDSQIPDIQVMGCGNCPFSHDGSNNGTPVISASFSISGMCMADVPRRRRPKRRASLRDSIFPVLSLTVPDERKASAYIP